MAAPIKNQTCHSSSRWSTVLISHRTPVISERLSKSVGFIDSNQSIISSGMIFIWCLAPHGVSYSRQSPWYLQAPPLRPAPHTASRSYPEDYICQNDVNLTSSRCGSNLSFAGIFIFDSIQGEFILLYTKQEIQSFSDEFIYSRMKELLSSPLCRDIPESEQVDCLFCLERYDCANSIPPEFFQLNDEFQRRRYINRRRAAK